MLFLMKVDLIYILFFSLSIQEMHNTCIINNAYLIDFYDVYKKTYTDKQRPNVEE